MEFAFKYIIYITLVITAIFKCYSKEKGYRGKASIVSFLVSCVIGILSMRPWDLHSKDDVAWFAVCLVFIPVLSLVGWWLGHLIADVLSCGLRKLRKSNRMRE